MHDTFNAYRIQQQLHAQFRQRAAAGIPVCSLFSLSLDCPDLRLSGLPPLPQPYLYWARPDRDLQLLGLGQAWRTTASGAQRFDTLSRAQQRLEQNWHKVHPPGSASASPGVFCALAFAPDDPMTACWDGLPNSILFVPRLLLRSEAGQVSLTFSCAGEELQQADAVLANWSQLVGQLCKAVSTTQQTYEEDKQQAAHIAPQTGTSWTEAVQNAIASIESGQLEKVVTARRVRVEARRSFQATKILSRLTRLYPSCLLLAIKLGGNTVVSATPERLATLRNGTIRCDALGGTTGRSQNSTRDRKLALRLLNSSKTQREHALVVASIQAALEPLCRELALPDTPAVVKLHNLQHLWTGITGRLRSGVSLLDAARRLHPTPAVAGTPTDRACQWLRDHENLQRGWYSGIVGWLRADGEGELSVLLRCAVLQGCNAELFAGAGIVADSDPQAELQETELKLQAMLEALQDPVGRTGSPLANSKAEQRFGH
jgi:isochorismate synthase